MAPKTRSPALAKLFDEFVESLRPDQMQVLVKKLSPAQEDLFEKLFGELLQRKDR